VDPDETLDPLEQAETYLADIRSGGRALTSLGASARNTDGPDPRAGLERLIDRLNRLEAAADALAPRGGRQAARLRSLLIGERAQIYVQIGALVARWVSRGGDVALTMDPDRTRVVKPLGPITSDDDDDGDRTVLGAETMVARAVRPVAPSAPPPARPAPPPAAPSLASVLAETRRAVRPVRPAVPDGPPPDILGADPGVPAADVPLTSIEPEVEWIDDQCNQLNRWKRSSAPLQHAVLSWLTARARWAQELLGPGDAAEQVARVYPKLSAFSKRERPGFVYGLRRDHAPQGESWRDDALSWRTQVKTLLSREPEFDDSEHESNPERALARLEEFLGDDPEPETVVRAVAEALDAHVRPDDPRLLRLVEDHDDALSQDPRFRRLRRALRSFSEGDADATMISGTLDESSLFGDLPAYSDEQAAALDAFASGLRILLVGGEPREPHRLRLLEATGVSKLEWAPATRGGGTAKLHSTAESIRNGSWDGVILLPRFCGHDVDAVLVPACRASDTPWLHVRGGYGVGPMRSAVRELAERIGHGEAGGDGGAHADSP
jgi:hypothetical protein